MDVQYHHIRLLDGDYCTYALSSATAKHALRKKHIVELYWKDTSEPHRKERLLMMATQYIALLRGINVGGHQVKMERLRELFGELGFAQVRSYIQSGNVFFASEERDAQALRTAIEAHLRAALGYDVATCLRTLDEMESLVARDPFQGITVAADMRLAVSFFAEPVAAIPLPYQTPDGAYDAIGMTPTELFVVWRLQNGRPGNSYGLIERQFKVPATTRFWHTTAKILAAAKSGRSG
jgi:uncharacterized protein (DUF1697 family)